MANPQTDQWRLDGDHPAVRAYRTLYAECQGRHGAFIATGNTYPLREDLQSFGWHWNARKRQWEYDGGPLEDDLCVVRFLDEPCIHVQFQESHSG